MMKKMLVNTDLRDLGTCAESVQKAMAKNDYDEAAQNIHRFLTLDSAVFRVGGVGTKEPGQSLKHSYEILRSAQSELKTIIEQKFDESLAAADEKTIQRFFKLFPMINEHSTGLKKFGHYLNAKIGKSGEEFYKVMQAGGTDDKRINVLYADTLTLLLEHIARLIETYQPIIDNFYGPDKLLDLIEIIEVEADKQAIRIISAFLQKRQLDEKIRAVDGYMRSGGKTTDKIEPRDLDVLLAEITMMHTRTELYWRFLKRRLGEAHRPLTESGEDGQLSPKLVAELRDSVFDVDEMSEEQRKEAAEKQKHQRKDRNKKWDTLLNRSQLSMKMQEILGIYILIEQFYMTELITKRIEMEDVEEGSLTSSLLDDVFFIVRKSIRRSITSSSVDCVCAMLNNGCTLLETDFFLHINKVIKSGYPSVGFAAEAYQTAQTAYNVLKYGKSVAQAGLESQRTAFLLALNNMGEAVKFLGTLKQGLRDEFERHMGTLSTNEKNLLENSVAQLDDLAKKFSQSTSIGIGKLVDSAFKPKLKSNADAYLGFNHELSDDEFTEFEINDPFMANFISQLDKLIAPFEKLLTEENYNELLGAVMAETARRLEAVLLQIDLNRNGALQLDREFRALTEYFTNIGGWAIRSKAVRFSQIVGLLNLDTVDEAVAYFHDSVAHQGQTLTSSDLKKFLKLRSDLSGENGPMEQIIDCILKQCFESTLSEDGKSSNYTQDECKEFKKKPLSFPESSSLVESPMPLPNQLGMTNNDMYSRLIKDRNVFVMAVIDDNFASVVIAQLLFLQSDSSKSPIHMYINSPGGSVIAGLGIYDTMQYISAPVHTWCIGQASSMGSLLLAAGEKGSRTSLPNSRMMIHKPFEVCPNVSRTQSDEVSYMNQRLSEIYSYHTGQPVQKVLDAFVKDTFMSASEAKDFGIIDRIESHAGSCPN